MKKPAGILIEIILTLQINLRNTATMTQIFWAIVNGYLLLEVELSGRVLAMLAHSHARLHTEERDWETETQRERVSWSVSLTLMAADMSWYSGTVALCQVGREPLPKIMGCPFVHFGFLWCYSFKWIFCYINIFFLTLM